MEVTKAKLCPLVAVTFFYPHHIPIRWVESQLCRGLAIPHWPNLHVAGFSKLCKPSLDGVIKHNETMRRIHGSPFLPSSSGTTQFLWPAHWFQSLPTFPNDDIWSTDDIYLLPLSSPACAPVFSSPSPHCVNGRCSVTMT